jgi:tetraacyldisaccharide-1-P 4'-kinase
MNLNKQSAAMYLAGYGSYTKPRLIELQYRRIQRYREAVRDQPGITTSVSEKKSAAGGSGPADQFRGTPRSVVLLTALAHPKDFLATLANNFTLAAGEVFEILSAQQFVGGTEGSSIPQ